MKRTLLLATTATLVAACGGGATNNTLADGSVTGQRDLTAAGSTDDLTVLPPPPDLVVAPYPAGPYGAQPGDVMAPLVWEGYADPLADAVANTKTYGTYSMDVVRRSGARYALIHISEYY